MAEFGGIALAGLLAAGMGSVTNCVKRLCRAKGKRKENNNRK